MRITSNYPLVTPTRILMDDVTPVAEGKAVFQVAESADLQIQPKSGATVVRSLPGNTRLTVLDSRNGWSLVANNGRPLGYIATRALARQAVRGGDADTFVLGVGFGKDVIADFRVKPTAAQRDTYMGYLTHLWGARHRKMRPRPPRSTSDQ